MDETEIMKILGLDSSGLVASVAVTEDGSLLGEYTVNYKKTHSQTLLPMLDTLAEMLELDLKTLDYIAVAGGPGSFTGLRIGSSTAKGLGLALDIPLVHVPTLEGMAHNFAGSGEYICPIMDARRGQVYTGVYRVDGKRPEAVLRQCAMDMEELIGYLNTLEERIVFLGDGVPVFKELIEEQMKVSYRFAPPSNDRQRAASVAALGEIMARAGEFENSDDHRPEYLRMSQAERERMEKMSKS